MKQRDKIARDRYLQRLQLAKSATAVNIFETEDEKKARVEKAKKDFRYMVEYYFPHYAGSKTPQFHVDFANMVRRNPAFKGFAQWGRGLAKSVVCDVLIPFWLFINNEAHYVVIIGNNYDKAKILLSDLQCEFEGNQRIINDFGEQKLMGSWEDGNFRTKSGFIGKALGMGQSVRGLRVQQQRPDMCICDDLEDKQIAKNPKRQDEFATWIERDLIPTMDGPIRRFIQANNRYAPRMIQTILQEKHPKWKVHQVNAYDPVTYTPAWKDKYPNDYYRKIEEEIGVLAAKAEYNNEPHVEGKIFTDEQIQWSKLPSINHFQAIVCHWDIAYAGNATSDFNAVRMWGLKDRNFYLIDCFVKRSKMRAALDWMCEKKKSIPLGVVVHFQYESQFWNDEVQRTIEESEQAHQVELCLLKVDTPRTNKYNRILSLQPYYQNSRIYYSDKLKAHNDTAEGLSQLKGIEPGYSGNDDAPDADEQAISKLSKYIFSPGRNGMMTGRSELKNAW